MKVEKSATWTKGRYDEEGSYLNAQMNARSFASGEMLTLFENVASGVKFFFTIRR